MWGRISAMQGGWQLAIGCSLSGSEGRGVMRSADRLLGVAPLTACNAARIGSPRASAPCHHPVPRP